ncbi:4-hydroxy-tetrahydrodipicolinate reductase [Isachenkonia alkalipeptolytica]|uniref:4-hydroxy-tetrahydrodipicolinate reductase n=1 Tax=Isachenkonia alkalipeptolytica TaxID=2565777 RepID=A0AA43XJH9_9CLOT|nr:4-hydroxy-tetrahydrodipicolinate reductase [Isachenkonia alkalipeptolytica]NBG87035.1 4-hydroxy-tetrahydrodipicolinate reductase [Isachenkonia alkalipeptolytica]
MKLLIWGISGTMGRNMEALAEQEEYWTAIQGVDSKTDLDKLDEDMDVIIDFSHPSSLEKLLGFALKTKTPVVVATTGFSEKQQQEIDLASKKIPVLQASNTSIGMNLLFSLVKQSAKALGSSVDIEIVETHHRRKKDAPSGSAKTLVHSLEEGLGEKRKITYGREGECPRETGEIGVHALRGGDIKGVHHVHFIDDMEQITLSHEAMDRKVFAGGALKAGKFLINKGPGRYGMEDVLNQREE